LRRSGAPTGGRPVHVLLSAPAVERPIPLAVSCPDGALAFGQVDLRSHQPAQRLPTHGVIPDTPVGVCKDDAVATRVFQVGFHAMAECDRLGQLAATRGSLSSQLASARVRNLVAAGPHDEPHFSETPAGR
jgi:non-ribosomal peptide synthetase component F